ncbi:MAG TPA: hypothetical protein VMT90_07555 [Dehalococcoidia bacterium]|nr:hypothetical protein [Dehalococcoidia bacterium]
MIWEARLAFILFFFLCWCIVGLLPWVVAAVFVRGRGALLALPLALTAACAAGVLVPALGLRDAAGFFLSLLTAVLGGAAGSLGGLAFHRRLQRTAGVTPRPAMTHAPGARRPEPPPAPDAQPPPS